MNSNKCELGVFVKCPHPEMIESIGISGFDFAVIDMEHTPLSPRDLYPLILAAERRSLSLVVRIPQKVDAYFKWCRDLNISRIQVPHVETREDALYAIKHTYFSPDGERGLCRFVRAADFSDLPKDIYIKNANTSNKLILQIEGLIALNNLQQIVEVLPSGVSIFIGPYDLSQSLGKPGRIWDVSVVSEMENIVTYCQSKDVGVGTFTDTFDGIEFWLKKGLSYIEYASDLNIFIDSAKTLVTRARNMNL
ncbi:MAG: aldolase/citrate lyase family protein [Paludibacter sp.]